jgi:hypothetical protein
MDEPEGGFVNLLWKRWKVYEPDGDSERYRTYEPFEGTTLRDVGFMRIPLAAVVGMYTLLRDEDLWDTEYVRPPHCHDGH